MQCFKLGVVVAVVVFTGMGALSHPLEGAESLTWPACLEEARRSNPELAGSRSQVEAARQRETAARGQLFPQISASAGTSRSQNEGSAAGNSFSYGLSGRQLLFDGLRTWNEVTQAGENFRAAEFSYRERSAVILLNLRQAFVDLLLQQARISLTREIAARREQNVKLVRLRYEAGREHRGSLLQAEAQLARAQFELKQSERNLGLAQFELARQMGRREYPPLTAVGELSTPLTPVQAPEFGELTRKHPQVQRAEAQVKAAQAGLQTTQGSFYPSLSAQGSLGRSAGEWPPEKDHWSVGLSLSWDVFTGGRRWAQTATARAQLLSAEADQTVASQAVYEQLLQRWTQFQNAIDQMGVNQKFLEAARERSRIAEAQYATGLLAFDNWTIIEDDYATARKNVLADQAGAMNAEAAWIQAQGGMLEDAK